MMSTPAVADGGLSDGKVPTPLSATIVAPFLESLRRDAFVMEAFNYDAPTIAESEDFGSAFTLLYRQLQALFGAEVFSIAAVDAEECSDKAGARRHRKVLCGLAHPRLGSRVWPKRSVSDDESLLRLADCATSAEKVKLFSETACPELKGFLESYGDSRCNTSQVLLAPYIVHHVSDIDFKQLKYREVLSLWEQAHKGPQLLYTRTALHTSIPAFQWPSTAYYSALLLVFLPVELPVSQEHADWLEALHISFQLSWGIPALEEKKQDLARLQAIETDMKQRAETFRKLQILAHDISAQIHQHTNRLLRELDPGAQFDKEVLGTLFEPGSDYPLWTGDHIIIRPQHDYIDRQPPNPCAIVYYALHLMLDKDPPSMTYEELRSSAERLVNSQAASQLAPKFMPLLHCLLQADQKAFRLLHELSRVHIKGGQLRFYSFAARLLLGPVGDDFTVNIYGGSSLVSSITTDNYLDDEIIKTLVYDSPSCFPEKEGTMPSVWARPLVDLISRRLQTTATDERVYVAQVDLYPASASEPCRVFCHLKGPNLGLNDVFRYLEDTPSADWESHGLRSVLLRLHESHSNRLRGYLRWQVYRELNQLVFSFYSR